MLKSKKRSWVSKGILIILLVYCFFELLLPNRSFNKAQPLTLNMSGQSKAEVVNGLRVIKEQIERIEKMDGHSGRTGFKVYSSKETANLLTHYQELRTGLEYLNRGSISKIKDWEGYSLEKSERTAYSRYEALEILNELDGANLPSKLLADFRVYLLPFGVPEISGLGGAGYAMISAPEITNKSIDQLRVTLLHELGHHLQARFMPSQNAKSIQLWKEYLGIRGGEWQGPGKVNTNGWSNSSEETFAEDFRLLFGKNQYYYGDISLGDPRKNSETAVKLRQFIMDLDSQQISESTKSPWIPNGVEFWLISRYYILIGWSIILVGMFVVLSIPIPLSNHDPLL